MQISSGLRGLAMADSWQEYQEEVARFFQSVGSEATTNFTVQGVRTKHGRRIREVTLCRVRRYLDS